MMDASHLREGAHLAQVRPLDGPRHGAIHVQGTVRAKGVIVGEVSGQSSLQVSFAQ